MIQPKTTAAQGARSEFEKRRLEFRGLPNWCEYCGEVLCCITCLGNHKPGCSRAAFTYSMSDEEFDALVGAVK